MELKLDLLQNSYDYFHISLMNYKIADEYGNHDEDICNQLDKQKWKIAFITMVQAVELLLKESLYRFHPKMVSQDIDKCEGSIVKTITIDQAIIRINSFLPNKIDKEKTEFIKSCAILRNEFIHFKVNTSSEELKKKYAMLFRIYEHIHELYIGSEIITLENNQKMIMMELNYFTDDMVIFKGQEMSKKNYDQLIIDIEENKKYHFYITVNGEKLKRFRYGYEVEELGQKYIDAHGIEVDDIKEYLYRSRTYCGACEAKKGEYHLELCDVEVCPNCYGQLSSCDCIVGLAIE